MTDFKKGAQSLYESCRQHRRHIHQYPELSLQEKHTSEYCQQQLRSLGYEVKSCWQHGFIADYVVDASKPYIAWRADMDALPILEKNEHDFVSKSEGVSHMCGHDSHMAIALSAAQALMENKQVLLHNIRFVFQPAEEKPPGGALGMIENGCLDKVEAMFGLHNNPELPCGAVYTRPGGFLAGADIFRCRMVGRGGHAARPQQCLDPVYASAQLISDWQSIVSRRIDPTHTAILSITQCQAGNTYNVIPDYADLAGTVRYYDKADRDTIKQAMMDYCKAYQEQGFEFEWDYVEGYEPVINDAASVQHIAQCAQQVVDSSLINADCDPIGFGEDFCYYLQHVPGAFFMLGSGNVEKNITQPLHSAVFDIDEDCLPIGVAIACQLLSRPLA